MIHTTMSVIANGRTIFGFSLLLRLFLLSYGMWHDKTHIVKYTDVDYRVFSDAGKYIIQNQSPYNRATYRYTPLLAWMLTLNTVLHESSGKLLFVLTDVFAGWLIYRILKKVGQFGIYISDVKLPRASIHLIKEERDIDRQCFAYACLWLFNPLPIIVSTRGNAESIMVALVLSTLMLMLNGNIMCAGIVYGISVHFKIYPLTYCLPIYLFLNWKSSRNKTNVHLHRFINVLWPSYSSLCFGVAAFAGFLCLTMWSYQLYGYEFLDNAYFYHVTRKDIRHNFSVYFYMLYLTEHSVWSSYFGLLPFLPQLCLLLLFSFCFYDDPTLCWFLHTFTFVTFNKVCTSQYFLWFLCFVPILLPRCSCSFSSFLITWLPWFIVQGVWLIPAYYLEFEGYNTFMYIWLAGVMFFMVNIWVIIRMVQHVQHDATVKTA